MASQLDWDLASIGDEELLRTMWQQAEDFGRKKEIRSRMYKLRESKLRDFYSTEDDMDQHFGSTARTTPSHGDSLVDQSFQSFKAKEIRDSISPPHGGIIRPDTSGWNVVASSEVAPDGRAYKNESLATTGGVQKLAGGQMEYSGRNEHMAKGSHQGDDKNYVKTAGETSKTNLQEKKVIGDPNSGRYQQSSTSVQSFSNVSSSEQRFTSDGGKGLQFQGYSQTGGQQQQNMNEIRQQQLQQQQQQQQLIQQSQNERYNSSANNQQYETTQDIKKTHDLSRKLTQQEIQAAQSMPGKILSRNVEYSDPNTKVITEMKELSDGSIIKTRRYERQGAQQSVSSQQTLREQRQSGFSKHEVKSQQQDIHSVESQRRDSTQNVRGTDAVDRAGSTTPAGLLRDQVETFGVDAHRTVKKDLSQNLRDQRMRNDDFIETERGCAAVDRRTSEKYTQEHSKNGFPRKQTEPDFATHGYPSTREPETRDTRQKASKPDFTTQGFPSVRTDSSPGYKRTVDVSSKSDYQTQEMTTSYTSQQQTSLRETSQKQKETDATVYHGFPAVNEPEKPKNTRNRDDTGYAPQGFPATREPQKPDRSQREPVTTTHGFPSQREPQKSSPVESIDHRYKVDQSGKTESSVRHTTTESVSDIDTTFKTRNSTPKEPNFTTQGFPSVRPKENSPRQSDYTTQGFPSVRPKDTTPTKIGHQYKVEENRKSEIEISSSKVTGGYQRKESDFTTQGFPSVRSNDTSPSQEQRQPSSTQPGQYKTPKSTTSEVSENETVVQSSTVRSTKATQDYNTQGFPAVRVPEGRRPGGQDHPQELTTGGPGPNRTTQNFSTVRQSDITSSEYDTRNIITESSKPQPKGNQRQTPSTEHEPSFTTTHGFPAAREPDRPDRRQPGEPGYRASHLSTTDYETTKEYSATQQQTNLRGRSPKDQEPDYSSPRGYPSVRDDERPSNGQKGPDYTTHGFPSVRKPTDDKTSKHITEKTTYESDVSETSSVIEQNRTTPQGYPRLVKHPEQDFTTHGFPSAKPQTGSPGRPGYPSSEPDYTTHGFPSARSPTKPASPQQPGDDVSYKRPTSESGFTITHGFPSTRESPKKSEPEYTTHGFPSVKGPSPVKGQGRPDYDDDASSVTTERTDFRGSRDSLYRTRVTLDVDASHDRFARSLRCVSPVDQRRGSTRSVRTSTSSIRSTQTPERKSYRSPSHESETSKTSSATMTKNRNVDISRKNTTTRSSTVDHKTSKTDGTTRRNLHKSNEVFDFNKEEPRRKGIAPKQTDDTRDEPLATQKRLENTERQLHTLKSVEEPIIVKKYIAPLCPGSSEDIKQKLHSSKTNPAPKVGKSQKVEPNLPSPLSKSPKETDLIHPKHPIINTKTGGGKQLLTKQIKLSETVKTNRLTLTKMRPQAPRISSPRKPKPSSVRTLPYTPDDAHKREEPRTSSVEIRNQRADRSTTDSTQRVKKHKSIKQTQFDSTDLAAENKPKTDPRQTKHTAPEASNIDSIEGSESSSSDERDSLEERPEPSKKSTPPVTRIVEGNAGTILEEKAFETAASEQPVKTVRSIEERPSSPSSEPHTSKYGQKSKKLQPTPLELQTSKKSHLLEKVPKLPDISKLKPQTTLIKKGFKPSSQKTSDKNLTKGRKVTNSIPAPRPPMPRPKIGTEATSVRQISNGIERPQHAKPKNEVRGDERGELLTDEETDLSEDSLSKSKSPRFTAEPHTGEQLNHLQLSENIDEITIKKKAPRSEPEEYSSEETPSFVVPKNKPKLFPSETLPTRSQKHIGKNDPKQIKPHTTAKKVPLVTKKEPKEQKGVKTKASPQKSQIEGHRTHLTTKYSPKEPQNLRPISQKPSYVQSATNRKSPSERTITKHEIVHPILRGRDEARMEAPSGRSYMERPSSQTATYDDNLQEPGNHLQSPSSTNSMASSPTPQQGVDENGLHIPEREQTTNSHPVPKTTKPMRTTSKAIATSHATQPNGVTVGPTANKPEKLQISLKDKEFPRVPHLEPQVEQESRFLGKIESSPTRAKPLATAPILAKKIPYLSPVPQESGEEGEPGLSETEAYFDEIVKFQQTPKVNIVQRFEADSPDSESDIFENMEELEVTAAVNLKRPQESQTPRQPKSPKVTSAVTKIESDPDIAARRETGSLVTSPDTDSIRAPDSLPTTFTYEEEYFSENEPQKSDSAIFQTNRQEQGISSSDSDESFKPADVTSEEDEVKAEEILTRTSSALKQPLPTNHKTAKITKVDTKSVTRSTVQDQTIIPTEFIKGKPVSEPKGTKPASKKPETVKSPASKPSPDKYTSTSVSTRTTEDIRKQQDIHKTQTDSKKPKTIYGPKTKEMPDGHEPRKPHSPERGTPVQKKAPEVSRSPHSSPERSKRPGKPTDSVEGIPKSPNKGDTKPTTHLDTTKSNVKFTKTQKVDNAVLRDDKAPRSKKPQGVKPTTEEREGYQPESPRSRSPTGRTSDIEYRRLRQTTDLDTEDINIELTRKNIRRDIDLVTVETDSSKQYVSEQFVDSEYDDTQKTVKTVINEPNTYPTEPFYLREQQPSDYDEPRKPADIKKPKAPFNRSETYEERCRQILGMGSTTPTKDEPQRPKPAHETQDFITSERITQETDEKAKFLRQTNMTTTEEEDELIRRSRITQRDDIDNVEESPSRSPMRRSKAPSRETSPRLEKTRPSSLPQGSVPSYRDALIGSPSSQSPEFSSTTKYGPSHKTTEQISTLDVDRETFITTSHHQIGKSPESSPTRKPAPRSPASSPERKPQTSRRSTTEISVTTTEEDVTSTNIKGRSPLAPTRQGLPTAEEPTRGVPMRQTKTTEITSDEYDVETLQKTQKTKTDQYTSEFPLTSPTSSLKKKPKQPKRSPEPSPARTTQTTTRTDNEKNIKVVDTEVTQKTVKGSPTKRSPDDSPTRRPHSTTVTDYEVTQKTTDREVTSKQVKGQGPTDSPRNQSPYSSLERKPKSTGRSPDDSPTRHPHLTTVTDYEVTQKTKEREVVSKQVKGQAPTDSPQNQSPYSSLERKPKSTGRSPDDSPTRRPHSTIVTDYEVTQKTKEREVVSKQVKGQAPTDSPRNQSPYTSLERKPKSTGRSPGDSPTRRPHSTTVTDYEVTQKTTDREVTSKQVKGQAPTDSPRNQSPYSSLERKPKSTGRSPDDSPTRRPHSTTVTDYEVTQKTTDREVTSKQVKGQAPTDSPRNQSPYSSLERKPKTTGRSPGDSPTRRPHSTTVTDYEVTQKTTDREVISKQVKGQAPTDSPRNQSPYSSLERKPKTTGRSPGDSPTRRPHSTTVTDYEVTQKTTDREVTSKQVKGQAPTESPRNQSPSSSLERKPKSTGRSPDDSPTRRPQSTILVDYETSQKLVNVEVIDSTTKRRTTDSPVSSVERKPKSTAQSPTRRTQTTVTTELEITEDIDDEVTRKTTKTRIPTDSPTASLERKPKTYARSPETSPTRRTPVTITTDYETSQTLIDVESGRKTTKTRPGSDSPRTHSSGSSPERRPQHRTRSPEYSPTRTTKSKTVEEYENIESTHKTTESITTELLHSHSPTTGLVRKPQDSPTSPNRKPKQPTRSPDQSPSRRMPSAVVKTKQTDTAGKPSQRPSTRSPESSPTRRTTSTVPDVRTKKEEPVPKTPKGKSPTSSPTRKPKGTAPLDSSPNRRHPEYETTVTSRDEKHITKKITEHEKHVSHITTAKIQLSPTSTRKASHPEKRSSINEIESSPAKPTSRPLIREEPSKTTRPSAAKSPTKPATEKVITDRRRIHEDYSQENYRSSIDKQTTSRSEVNETELTPKSVTSKRVPTAKKPITERKESAPVYGTKTTKDVTQKMTRSTSDNVIKTSTPRRTKPEIEMTHVEPTKKSPRKSSVEKTPAKTDKRPNKHLATKTINLTATNTIINSEDMENVIIDIQQAKSSREPSPNKMIPVPVPYDEDTGRPRFPDKVQEPEEERRKSRVKNIPIFEEETNDFVGCRITEVEDVFEERQKKKTTKTQLIEDEETFVTTNRTTKTARGTSPYKGEPTQPRKYDEDDEYLLSVHDKVNKFITTAEEVKKPKTSTPFHRDSKLRDEFTEEDDCLLSVNAKVNKFMGTAESITKPSHTSRPVDRPIIQGFDEDIRTDEYVSSVSEKVSKFINTAEKLTAPAPQKSPELVAQIERQKPKSYEEPDDISYERRGSPTKTSYKPILKSSEAIKKAKSVFETDSTTSSVRTNTKQKDVLSRPSVWEGRKTPQDDVGLQDIGVYKKRSSKQSQYVETVDHGRSPSPDEEEFLSRPRTTKDTKISSLFSDSVSSKKDIFENKITISKTASHSPKTVKGKPEPTRKPSGPKISPDYSPTRRPDSTTENYSSSRNSNKRAGEYTSDNRYSTTSTIRKESDRHVSTTTSNQSPRSRPADKPLTRLGQRPENQSPSKSRQSPSQDLESHYYEKYSTTNKVTSSSYPDDYSPTRRERSPSDRYPGQESPRTPVNSQGYDGYSTTYSKDYIEKHHGTASKSRITDDSMNAKRNIFEKPHRDTPSRTSSDRGKPSYMEHTVSSLEHRRDSTEQKTHQRRSSTDSLRETPSYMDHTISSLEHVNKGHYRKSSTDSVTNEPRDGNPRSGTKFGVELKHVEGKFEGPRRKSSSSEIPHIEEIDDIELLEQMLQTVVGYEQRRRIRSQIREVKKVLQSESKEFSHKSFLKHEHSSSRGSSPSPDRHMSPSRRMNIRNDSSQFIESESTHITKHEQRYVKERSQSPVGKVKTITTVTEVRKSSDKPQKISRQIREEVKEEKPIWATKNILKKASENERTVKTGSIKKSVSSKTQTTQRQQILTDEDCVTSSYGIGPTDEEGRPLFGIRALKKKTTQPSESTKVTGSVITESYYSENGAPPVGERKVYMYSTNPEEVEELESKLDKSQRSETIKHERSSKGGLTSVTRVDKISKGGNIDGQDILAITDRPATTSIDRTPAKLVRRGSVKEMTEKFVRKDSNSSTSEKLSSSSYPKAGLILRTQTHTNRSATSEDDLYYDDPAEECDIQIKTFSRNQSGLPNESASDTECEESSKTINKSTKSFLNSSGSKVTGVSDILDRMRNADNVVEAGDTADDKEARSLLNKFLGATVLMSGMESMVPKEVTTTTCIVGSPSGHEVKTTRVKTTITREDSSAPVVRETCDIEEIWDEQVLKDLLQKSTTYEERRQIRARLRQLMAEREACADIVASISAELQKEGKLEQQTKFQIEKVPSDSSFEEEEEDDNEEEEIEEIAEDDESTDTTEYEDIEDIIEKKEEIIEKKEEVEEDLDEEEIDEEESSDEEAEEEEVEDEDQENTETVDKTDKISDQSCTTSHITAIKNEDIIEPKPETTLTEQDSSTKEDLTKTDTTEQEESLLLPLLQGLLHKNTVPQGRSHSASDINVIKLGNSSIRSVDTHNTGPIKITQPNVETSKKLSNMNNSTGHHVEDSGTESGEDLKLLAAGLRDSMQIHSLNGQGDSALITEVTTALNRLEQSLKDGNGLRLDVNKKNALLSLVDRLQTGLLSPEKISPPTPAPGQNPSIVSEVSSTESDANKDLKQNHQRFAKRRNRANRHTVGVSKEELADARRYIEEMVMKESISNSTTPESAAVTPPEFAAPLEKSKTTSELATPETAGCSLHRPNKFVPKHLKDSSDMFSSTYNKSQDFKLEDPPIVHMREKKPKYQAMRQSANVETLSSSVVDQTEQKRPYSECYSFDYNKNQPKLQNPQETIAESSAKDDVDLETEQDQAVHEKNLYNKTHHGGQPIWKQMFNGSRPNAPGTDNTESSIDARLNRFSNKKLLMKRANTIDIPKPMRYMNDIETDSEAEERGINSTKSIGLRGTVQVSVKDKPKQVVPAFQPKTENDHKFLAFINKQGSSPGLGWKNSTKTQPTPVSNWSNKFGNIKNSFETGAIVTSNKPPVPVTSAARNFWKKSESSNAAPQQQQLAQPLKQQQPKSQPQSNPPQEQPKLSQQQQLRVPNSPKANDKIVKPPWADKTYSSDVMNGALKAARLRDESSTSIGYVPKPVPVNKFSHAPMSAFKPVENIATINPQNQFKPIQADSTQVYAAQTQPSPTKHWLLGSKQSQPIVPAVGLPWTSKPASDGRVPNKLSSKFGNKSPINVNVQRQQSLGTHDQSQSQGTRMEQKRPSLPNTAQYDTEFNRRSLEKTRQRNDSLNSGGSGEFAQQTPAKEFPPLPYICTDYTQPGNVSTYIPENPLVRNDSLTNPNAEPLILTSDRPIISPNIAAQQQPLKIFDFPSSPESVPTTPNHTYQDFSDDEDEVSGVKEYKAESKVMRGPVSQQAVTVSNRTNRVGDEEELGKHSQAAKQLLSVMKNIGSSKSPERKQTSAQVKYNSNETKPISIGGSSSAQDCISPDGSNYHAPILEPIFPSLNTSGTNRMPAYNGVKKDNYNEKNSSFNGSYQNSKSGSYSSAGIKSQSSTPMTPQTPQTPDTPQSTQSFKGQYQQNPLYVSPAIEPQTKKLGKYSGQSNQYESTYNQDYPQPSFQEAYKSPNYQPPVYDYQRSEDKVVQQLRQQQSLQEAVKTQTTQSNQQKHNRDSFDEREKFYQQQIQEINRLQQKQREATEVTQNSKQKYFEDSQKFKNQPALQHQSSHEEAYKEQRYAYQQESEQLKMKAKATKQLQSDRTSASHTEVIQKQALSYEESENSSQIISSSKSLKAQSEATKTTFNMPAYQKNLTSAEPKVHISSQPADTPDIVKSSLPKDDIPILKKFGPSRPHLYHPNAYQGAVIKTDRTVQSKGSTVSSVRKYSEPAVNTKFIAPKIVETPSSPLPAGKGEIPAHIVFNNIAQFSGMGRRSIDSSRDNSPASKYRPNPLSKSDSWHQIVQQQNATVKPPSPKGFNNADFNPLRRAKSGHSLAVPKMYEAAMDKSEVIEKSKIVAAYFSGQKSPNSLSRNSSQSNIPEAIEASKYAVTSTNITKKSSINRIRSSEKASVSNPNPSSGLVRSQTVPHMVNLNLLDESNVDDSFEQLLNAS